MSKRLLLIIPVALALIAAGCGSSSSNNNSTTSSAATTTSSSSSAAAVTIATKDVSGVGTVLVNGQGKTLYIFQPDNAKKVTCTGACASIWPPQTLGSGAKATASGGVKASLLSSDPNPAGGRVVTYSGWPLYSYVTDTGPGTAKGQGIKLNGGLWYVISPGGRPITTRPKGSSDSGYSSGY